MYGCPRNPSRCSSGLMAEHGQLKFMSLLALASGGPVKEREVLPPVLMPLLRDDETLLQMLSRIREDEGRVLFAYVVPKQATHFDWFRHAGRSYGSVLFHRRFLQCLLRFAVFSFADQNWPFRIRLVKQHTFQGNRCSSIFRERETSVKLRQLPFHEQFCLRL